MMQGQSVMQEVYPVTGEGFRFRIEEQDGNLTIHLDDNVPDGPPTSLSLAIDSRETGEGYCRQENGRTLPFAWAWVGGSTGSGDLHLWLDGDLFIFRRADTADGPGRRRGDGTRAGNTGDVLAPMPGAVLEVLVGEGEKVERNQTVVVMESMKMELLITAPRDGVVNRVSVQAGQQVERGMRLLELAPES